MYLLDTNILSEVVRRHPDAGVVRRLGENTSASLFGSAVTRYELRYGAALRDDADDFWARIADQLLPLVTWVPVTQAVAERAGVLAASLRRQGRPCGSLDPLLAATALEAGLILVTRNTRHFEPVPGIAVENWFAAD
ncbi:type II toxin-antitoxin system VapC family toxin [Spiribacter halobius]|uniref:Ribonuclease VapC n=1 Tax=Sediminicurvatus halobius TaxID=2182432 RepID=A0A2U2MX88_9GAMM|nr:type II toxin-antitoxin system VapC family toxin [Spiribacter halobius]PWG61442.1 hypothetical protein DEM34_16570 [Spiribacter halobius]UEX76934.1 type II toxin-antitoxin system VapC family toxin [Spiribacter halobius]